MDAFDPGLFTATIARTAIVSLLAIGGLRAVGKHHTGDFNTFDLMLILIVANAVQNAMTRGSGALTMAIASAGTLIAMAWVWSQSTNRWPGMERRLLGTPRVLAYDGHFVEKNLAKEDISEDDVLREVREFGLMDIEDVRLAVLEIDGSISIVPRRESRADEGA
jgi:uncharacterized membrane protein YcaP (DUF421 family)